MENTETVKEVVVEVTAAQTKKVSQSTIAIVLSVAALLMSSYNLFFVGSAGSSTPTTPQDYIKSVAVDAGLKKRTYDKCTDNTEISEKINREYNEIKSLETLLQTGIGTPFNLIVTDSQILPVNGAYPYEAFEFIINQINTNGRLSDEEIAQFEIPMVDYSALALVKGFDMNTDAYRGNPEAPIKIYEYSDYQCPFCTRVHGTLKKLSENKDVTWVYRNLPLDFHPMAMPAAIAGECVRIEKGQDAFWEYADTIFENQDKLQG